MKFIPVDPNDIPNLREGRRGRISYPIIKGFLELNIPLAKLDRAGIDSSLVALSSSLNSYIRTHDVPIKVVQRSNELYLVRLDLNDKGKPVKNWRELYPRTTEGAKPSEAKVRPVKITPTEVATQGKRNENKATK